MFIRIMPREEMLKKVREILGPPDLSQQYHRGPIQNPPPRIYGGPNMAYYLTHMRQAGIIKDPKEIKSDDSELQKIVDRIKEESKKID
jgi:hypothetical protein